MQASLRNSESERNFWKLDQAHLVLHKHFKYKTFQILTGTIQRKSTAQSAILSPQKKENDKTGEGRKGIIPYVDLPWPTLLIESCFGCFSLLSSSNAFSEHKANNRNQHCEHLDASKANVPIVEYRWKTQRIIRRTKWHHDMLYLFGPPSYHLQNNTVSRIVSSVQNFYTFDLKNNIKQSSQSKWTRNSGQ